MDSKLDCRDGLKIVDFFFNQIAALAQIEEDLSLLKSNNSVVNIFNNC